MKLLLDESLPQDLRLHLPEHEVVVTADQNIEHQQNVAQLDIAVIILVARSNRLQDLLPLLPHLLGALSSARPGQIYRVAT